MASDLVRIARRAVGFFLIGLPGLVSIPDASGQSPTPPVDPGRILLNRQEIDFGSVPAGNPATEKLSFRNPLPLAITCQIETPSTIRASSGSISLQAYQELKIDLTFRAFRTGAFAGDVRVRCSAPGAGGGGQRFESRVRTHAVSMTIGPILPPADTRQEVKDVFWNTWITDQTSPPRELEQVRAAELYTVFFDLSPYEYRKPNSLIAGARAGKELATALATTPGDTLELIVYPVVAGDAVELSEDSPRAVDVDLRTFRGPPQRPAAPGSALDFARIAGAARIHESKEPAIPVLIVAKKAGCASVGLSIWRKTGTGQEPLDFISRTVAVTDAAGTVPGCTPSAPSASAGLASLLSTGIERPADAAIHIFPMSNGKDLVLYVTAKEHHFWTSGESLESLLKNPNALPRNLFQAHQEQGYGKTMQRLTETLFPPVQTRATPALKSLRELTVASGRPSVLARLVKPNGKMVALPLGLIDDGTGRPLGWKMDFLQALPREKPTSTCVSSFRFAMPAEILDLRTSKCTAEKPSVDLPTWDKLLPYLQDQTAATKPEGFLLLAHQAGGSISYSSPSERKEDFVRPGNFYRTYLDGSVAIMVACNAAGPEDGEEPDWLEALNERGVSASIASPFTIPTKYGTCFAMHLAQQIQLARKSPAPITILELHRRAVTKMTDDLKSNPRMVPLLQEFVLVGDPGVQICNQ